MRIPFENITGFGLELPKDMTALLTIEFCRPPTFHEYDAKLGSWVVTTKDFTKNQAVKCKRHVLKFPNNSLNNPLGQLLEVDVRLKQLAQTGLPSLDNPYFSSEEGDDEDIDDEDGQDISDEGGNAL